MFLTTVGESERCDNRKDNSGVLSLRRLGVCECEGQVVGGGFEGEVESGQPQVSV